MKFLNNINLVQNELQNARIQNLSSDPGTPVEGQIYHNSTDHKLYYYNGTAWVPCVDTWVSNISVTAPITTTGGATPTIAITAASGGGAGSFAAADYTTLHAATDANTASAIVKRDASGNFTAGTITATTVTGLSAPSGSSDAVNKAYADGLVNGLSWKQAVRVASAAALAANTYSNGSSGVGATLTGNSNGALTVDGVAVATSDRVLVKNEVTASHNGIYIVTVAGSGGAAYILTRSTDSDTSAKLINEAVFASEGTANADTSWVQTTDSPITIGSTSVVYAQFGSGTSYTGTSNRIDVTGTVIDISATYVGQTSITTLGTITTGTWSATTIALNKGGTGATTAAGARANLVAAGIYSVAVGDGSSTSIDITHSLNSRDVVTTLYQNSSTYDVVLCDVRNKDANTVTLLFAVAPTTNQYKVVVLG